MATNEATSCPICGTPTAKIIRAANGEIVNVRCRTCGNFAVVASFYRIGLNGPKSKPEISKFLPYLSAYTRQASERGEQVMLDSRNWQDFALAHMGTPISKKVTKLLEVMAARSGPGSRIPIDHKDDYPLVDAESPNELFILLDHLKKLDQVREHGQMSYSLTVKGWERLEAVASGGGIPGKCFVAMSFDKSLKDAYEKGIFLAIKKDCKMEPVRVDLVQHNEKICDKILAEIRSSQFMVADFTLQRAGVYFEAGFAMGLGRPVIWTCREDDFKNTHFDTRQYNHIRWKSPEDLRDQLTDRIRATILK